MEDRWTCVRARARSCVRTHARRLRPGPTSSASDGQVDWVLGYAGQMGMGAVKQVLSACLPAPAPCTHRTPAPYRAPAHLPAHTRTPACLHLHLSSWFMDLDGLGVGRQAARTLPARAHAHAHAHLPTHTPGADLRLSRFQDTLQINTHTYTHLHTCRADIKFITVQGQLRNINTLTQLHARLAGADIKANDFQTRFKVHTYTHTHMWGRMSKGSSWFQTHGE
jgi:hypothetical protein